MGVPKRTIDDWMGDELTSGEDPSYSDRHRWCTRLAERLVEAVTYESEGPRITDDEALRQAMVVWAQGEEAEGRTGKFGDHPSEIILREQLTQQGVDEVTAIVVARTLLRVDLSSLLLTTAEAGRLLRLSKTTLDRKRDAEVLPPAVKAQSKGRASIVLFWAAEILWVLGWRRDHPPVRGPFSWYPEPAPVAADPRLARMARTA